MILALIALATIPHNLVIVDQFEYIEVNHLYDPSSGAVTLDQYIFWDGDDCHGWMMVPRSRVKREDLNTDAERDEYDKAAKAYQRNWLAKEKRRFVAKWLARGRNRRQIERNWDPPNPPKYNPPFIGKMPQRVNGKSVLVVYHNKRIRRIIADFAVETWTTIDPERENQKHFDKDDRRGLTNE